MIDFWRVIIVQPDDQEQAKEQALCCSQTKYTVAQLLSMIFGKPLLIGYRGEANSFAYACCPPKCCDSPGELQRLRKRDIQTIRGRAQLKAGAISETAHMKTLWNQRPENPSAFVQYNDVPIPCFFSVVSPFSFFLGIDRPPPRLSYSAANILRANWVTSAKASSREASPSLHSAIRLTIAEPTMIPSATGLSIFA